MSIYLFLVGSDVTHKIIVVENAAVGLGTQPMNVYNVARRLHV